MGVAHLSRVTVISPRSEYEEVAKALAQFEDFHPIPSGGSGFDPGVQELTVKAVRLFAQADQAAKDLGLQLIPSQIDVVFRGAKVPQSEFDAGTWGELLGKAETQLAPLAEQVRTLKSSLQKAAKDQTDAENLIGALSLVSSFSSDLSGLSDLRMFKAVVTVADTEKVEELRKSLPECVFLSQPISKEQSLVLAAVTKADEAKLDRALKILELKPLAIPAGFPQNPAEAFRRAEADLQAATAAKEKVDGEMAEQKLKNGTALLAVRELSEVARKMLDEARVSGSMVRFATISGYIAERDEARWKQLFRKWVVHAEPAVHEEGGNLPTLMKNSKASGVFEPITREQGIPGHGEVDPTPLVSFVFPIFFGMMFADVGHGILLTLFMVLVRQRGIGNMRHWANIFIVAGISSIVFGAIFGEFFELSLYNYIPIPPVVEVIKRAAGSPDTFNITGVYLVMEVAILIGVAHLVTGLVLDIYQGIKENERVELALEKIPALTMYLSGVGYGLAFIGVGFDFNVLKTPSAPAPLLGIPNNVLGEISLAVLLPSMLWLMVGRTVFIALGEVKGVSAIGALSNGGLELFERISQFLSNTISYVRLAVMLLVHAALLLIINLMQPWSNPVFIAPWVIFNLLILSFEAFIVYVQDLRLHLYEFFTKFFQGTGTPFRKILPDRARIKISWR